MSNLTHGAPARSQTVTVDPVQAAVAKLRAVTDLLRAGDRIHARQQIEEAEQALRSLLPTSERQDVQANEWR